MFLIEQTAVNRKQLYVKPFDSVNVGFQIFEVRLILCSNPDISGRRHALHYLNRLRLM